MSISIAFIGGGNMAQALVKGLADHVVPASSIHVVDPHLAQLGTFKAWGCSVSDTMDAQLADRDILVFAVKPQTMQVACQEAARWVSSALVISVAAGVTLASLRTWLGEGCRLVRCMPNTPALIGQGMTGLVAEADLSIAQRNLAESMLSSVGKTLWVESETMLDAVTAISGSGPAYVFYFIEAMLEAAKNLGFNEQDAMQLVMSTISGATQLVNQSSESVLELRARVTSKGGTTAAALHVMESEGLKDIIIKGAKAAALRAHELGQA